MPTFRRREAVVASVESPERLFDDLPRDRKKLPSLFSHQADVLRDYLDKHLTTRDVALELPTGAGKTVPGLLIAEWRRRRGERVAYACPNQQLARQTARAAREAGVDVVLLVGRHKFWPTADKVRYETADAVAVTTYSTIFNAQPALEPAQVLLFDDAHAGEEYVAASWSATIRRNEDPAMYLAVLSLLRSAFSGITYQALAHGEETVRRLVHLVGADHVQAAAASVRQVLHELPRDNPLYWSGEALGDHLDRCVIYVSWSELLIRPVVPPTQTHRHFTDAAQRIYLSATLGESGELERAFGRTPIERLAIPEGWDSRNAGRRFIVFPNLQTVTPPREYARELVREAGKAVVLAPSERRARQALDLVPDGVTAFGPSGDADALIVNFRQADHGVLTLPNRYDGLDLPECYVNVVDGMPRGAHLQERFISDTLQAGRALRERLRTRVTQALGRCTRGLGDHSMVIVLGDDLTRFLLLPEVHDALRTELQAEINIGKLNSGASIEEMLEYSRSFLAQDTDWKEQVEPQIVEERRAATRATPGENAQMAAAAMHEVRATTALWSGDFTGASEAAQAAAEAVTAADLTGYRALWLYLASAWLSRAGQEHDDQAMKVRAGILLRRAHAAGRHTHWLHRVAPLPNGEIELSELDESAVQYATRGALRRKAPAKWASFRSELMGDLAQDSSSAQYERGLRGLGQLLGAESYKPDGNGRCDAAWVWGALWWLAVEAKSDEQALDSLVSQRTVREAGDHLKTLALDRQETIPGESVALIVSARQLVDPVAAAVAEPNLYLADLVAIEELARDAVASWTAIRAEAGGLDDDQAAAVVRRLMHEHQILPSDVRTRLLAIPVHG